MVDKAKLASILDLANHHQDATPEDIAKLCQKVVQYGLHAAFVNPYFVPLARELLGADKPVGTVVSFPLGQESKDVKIISALSAVRQGADEIDVSINIGLFKAGEHQEVLEEMGAVVAAAKEVKKAALVKFIIETGFLSKDEIKKASELTVQSGADFVKTNSGWGPRGASVEDVRLIRAAVGERAKIKAAGGIHTYEQAIAFINAGVDRIGTSRAVEILEGKVGGKEEERE